MPRFSYTARDRSGQSVAATLDAPSRKDALRLLTARGLQPVQVEEAPTAATRPTANSAKAKTKADSTPRPTSNSRKLKGITLGRKDRLPFLTALADLISSGLSAGEAVRLLSVRIQEPALRALCGGLWERLSEGAPLS
jgi:type II secretory pathway component PulF